MSFGPTGTLHAVSLVLDPDPPGGGFGDNGMVYNRGQRADYDALERLGNPGWGWDDMLPVFKGFEDPVDVVAVDWR